MKRTLCTLLAAAMLVGTLSACGGTPAQTAGANTPAASGQVQTAPQETQAQAAGDTQTVVDMEGNTVVLPKELNSIAITSWKGAFENFVLLGRTDLITAMSDTSRYVWVRHAFPEILDIPDFGSFNDVNMEELVQLDPDIIFSPQAAADANTKMLELGLPVYVDGIQASGDPWERNREELAAIAELIGETEKEAAYLAWEEKWLNLVAERVADIPESERKTVYLVRNSTTETFNNQNILGMTVSLAGGINVAADAFSDSFYSEVSAEEVVAWNPDVIFAYSVSLTNDELADLYEEMQADTRFTGLQALETGDCYIMPHGIANWGGKLETSLGVLTMAKTLYPDLFEDISIRETAEEFYRTFVGYELEDADWDIIYRNCTGAKTLALD